MSDNFKPSKRLESVLKQLESVLVFEKKNPSRSSKNDNQEIKS